MCIEDIEKEVRKLDKHCPVDCEDFRAAVILLASVFVGARPELLQRYTGYAMGEILTYTKNLKRAKLWNMGEVVTDHWLRIGKKNSKIQTAIFWADVCVARGFVLYENQTYRMATDAST